MSCGHWHKVSTKVRNGLEPFHAWVFSRLRYSSPHVGKRQIQGRNLRVLMNHWLTQVWMLYCKTVNLEHGTGVEWGFAITESQGHWHVAEKMNVNSEQPRHKWCHHVERMTLGRKWSAVPQLGFLKAGWLMVWPSLPLSFSKGSGLVLCRGFVPQCHKGSWGPYTFHQRFNISTGQNAAGHWPQNLCMEDHGVLSEVRCSVDWRFPYSAVCVT